MRFALFLVVCCACLQAQVETQLRAAGSVALADAVVCQADANLNACNLDPVYHPSPEGAFAVLRFAREDSAAVTLHFRDFHLPQGAQVFVYGVDRNGQPHDVRGPFKLTGPLQSGDFWTLPIPGGNATVELQAPSDWEGSLPFYVDEVEGAEPWYESPVEGVADGGGEEVRTSFFQGSVVAHKVKDGWAVAEGDIILGHIDELESVSAGNAKRVAKDAVAYSSSQYRWPNGVVPYVIDAAVVNPSRVTSAIQQWNTALSGSITWVPWTGQNAYVKFFRTTSYNCQAQLGYTGRAAQPINLHDTCSVRNVIHEMGHAAGLFHEHTRADRDSHITVHWENMVAAQTSQFLQNLTAATDIGTYDHASLMHYGPYTYSANGLPTMTSIPAGIAMGASTMLTARDISALRSMYGSASGASATVPVILTTSPPGLPMVVDGAAVTGPRTFYWVPGSTHTATAVVPAPAASRYAFARWNDSPSQTRSIVTPSAASTFTATYSVEHRLTASVSGNGSVASSSTSPDGYYPAGTYLTLTGKPALNSCFVGWSGTLTSTASDIRLTISKPYSETAKFLTGSVQVPATVTVPAAGGNISLPVTATSGCLWRGTSGAPWVSLKGYSGSGSGVITLLVDKNNSQSWRATTIMVNGLTVSLQQLSR